MREGGTFGLSKEAKHTSKRGDGRNKWRLQEAEGRSNIVDEEMEGIKGGYRNLRVEGT